MQVKISQAIPMITDCIRAGLVPLISGSPGVGKSAIVKQIAKDHALKVIDFRLAQCDPTDLNGFPHINGKKAGYLPMDTFPIEGDDLPKGCTGWLLFLDELTSASPAVQAAAYKIILDKMVGNHKLHPNVAIVGAGNLETDNAIVQPMSTALQSRMIHLELACDAKEWLDWAASNGIDYRITSYINFRPDALYRFDPNHTDKTYASPRTWEFANRLIKDKSVNSPNIRPLLAGTISEGIATEFLGFCKIIQDLPTISSIITNPATIAVPSEPSILFALCGSLAHNANTENIDAIMTFLPRMPVEFQVVCLREMVRRNPELMGNTAIQQWIQKSAADLF